MVRPGRIPFMDIADQRDSKHGMRRKVGNVFMASPVCGFIHA
jgi:hypothetical protein